MAQWEFKQGKGLWKEFINSETKESSIKHIEPTIVKSYCRAKKHYFVALSPSSRECVCRKCGIGATYVLGLQRLVKGKIISLQG